jgi:membrane protein DedA with SNARE-associated domain
VLGLLCLPGVVSASGAQEHDAPTQSRHHMTDELRVAVDKVQPLVERYGYAGVVGTVSAEGLGVPLPGQTTLMAAALEAARGKLDILILGTLALLAAVVGNSVGYLIGRTGGRQLLRKFGASESREQKITALFERYGGGFVVLARFLDGPRQLNGLIAGMLEMPFWVFTVFNVIGALLWVGIWGLGTYYLWEHVATVHILLSHLNPWAAAAAGLCLLAMLVYLFRGRRAGGE